MDKICKLGRYIARTLQCDSITGPIGINGTLIGPAPAQDSMRMNGADATYIGGSIVELTAGQTSKGSV
jgi:hypothetical protein